MKKTLYLNNTYNSIYLLKIRFIFQMIFDLTVSGYFIYTFHVVCVCFVVVVRPPLFSHSGKAHTQQQQKRSLRTKKRESLLFHCLCTVFFFYVSFLSPVICLFFVYLMTEAAMCYVMLVQSHRIFLAFPLHTLPLSLSQAHTHLYIHSRAYPSIPMNVHIRI